MLYNWQLKDWPNFRYKLDYLEDRLFVFAQKVGNINGLLDGLSFDARNDAMIEIMVVEAINTSEIEGEFFSREDVMSSIRKNLGFVDNIKKVENMKAEGVSELMIEVKNGFSTALTEDSLFLWHKKLMKGTKGINEGKWRSGQEPMQVVSGAIGREKIHFEAPPSSQVPEEMRKFIQWFNKTGSSTDSSIKNAPIRSAVAHIYFESIHPFEDGNGRIGRAISEKALAQGIGHSNLISLSRTIEGDKKSYYDALKMAQRSKDITMWVEYFLDLILASQTQSEDQIGFSLKKAKFLERFRLGLNARQLKVIERVFKEGPSGFDGGLNARKYMAIAKTSKATATRDLQDLLRLQALTSIGGGRSTRYELNLNF
ncbi:MAG: Fic family protein [Cyclobacteriaceae bacterium]